MDILRIIVFFAFVIVLAVLWRWYKRSRLPENYKDTCVCGHRRSAHISTKCDACECPWFVLGKNQEESGFYFLRDEGPAIYIIGFVAMSVTVILAVFLPRHVLQDKARRMQEWLDREERKAKEEEEEQ